MTRRSYDAARRALDFNAIGWALEAGEPFPDTLWVTCANFYAGAIVVRDVNDLSTYIARSKPLRVVPTTRLVGNAWCVGCRDGQGKRFGCG